MARVEISRAAETVLLWAAPLVDTTPLGFPVDRVRAGLSAFQLDTPEEFADVIQLHTPCSRAVGFLPASARYMWSALMLLSFQEWAWFLLRPQA